MEDVFEQIIQQAIDKAEEVDCDIPQFKKGLENMLYALKERLECED